MYRVPYKIYMYLYIHICQPYILKPPSLNLTILTMIICSNLVGLMYRLFWPQEKRQ